MANCVVPDQFQTIDEQWAVLQEMVRQKQISPRALQLELEKIRIGLLHELDYALSADRERPQWIYPPEPVLRLRPIEEQIEVLRQYPPFARLDPERLEHDILSPANDYLRPQFEGLLAVPNWSKVANTYTDAIYQVHLHSGALLSSELSTISICQKTLCLSAKTKQGIRRIGQPQCHDFTVLSVQMGKRLAGLSPNAAKQLMLEREWPLDPYSLIVAWLAHHDIWGYEKQIRFGEPPYLTELACLGCRVKRHSLYTSDRISYPMLRLTLHADSARFGATCPEPDVPTNLAYPTAFSYYRMPYDEDLM